jgi:hypothetical protein
VARRRQANVSGGVILAFWRKAGPGYVMCTENHTVFISMVFNSIQYGESTDELVIENAAFDVLEDFSCSQGHGKT